MSSLKTMAVVGLGFLLFAPAAHADTPNACADAYARAQELRTKRQLLGARTALRICSQQTCPGFIVKDCTTWLDEVQASLASVVPVATDNAGNDLAGVRVSMDGQVLFESSEGRSVEVDPGKHTFTFELTGPQSEQAPAAVKNVVVAEGEKNKRIAVVLQKPGAPMVAVSPPPPAAQVQVQPLQPARPVVPISFQANRDGIRIQADSFETNTRQSCTAPCAAQLPAGNYMVGMARGDGTVRGMQPVYIGGPGTLKATYVSHTGLHVAGILLLIGSVLLQIGLSADAVDKKTCSSYFDGTSYIDYCKRETDANELGAATTIGILGFTAGIIMIAQKNRSDVTFVPLGVGALSMPREGGAPREGAWRAGSAVPQGGAIQIRF